jgi:molybdenum cofactor cytidylyltransferase
MIFGEVPVGEAQGAILVHSTRCGTRTLKKGLRLAGEHIAALSAAGIATVVAARLEADDVHEDEAARLIADALAGPGVEVRRPFTGRANLFADARGVATLDIAAIDGVNLVDEAVTVATVPAWDAVEAGQMVATVKIIPYAVPRPLLERCLAAARASNGAIGVAAFRPCRIALVMTTTGAIKDKVLDKTASVLADRLRDVGAELTVEHRTAHRTEDLSGLLAPLARDHDMVLVYGASAIADRRDVIPAAVEMAGGAVEHLGMPVDPGNLLLLARIGATPVLGLPGCARSPRLNGFDWVLQRLVAGLAVTPRDIMAMGVGGLLKEIPLRPRPREEAEDDDERAQRAPHVAALVLAAGQSRRMGSANKMLVEVDGRAMVRHAVETAVAARTHPVVVVTGHAPDAVAGALEGLDVTLVHNPDYAEGLSTSLRTGIAALPGDIDAVAVILGDMPRVGPAVIDRLVDAYNPAEGRAIVVPTHRGKRGNPVLWDRRFFEAMRGIGGDTGARHLIGEHEELVAEVELPDDAVLLDIDTPEALARLKG